MNATFEQQILNLQPQVVNDWINQLNNEFNWNITFEQGNTKSKTYDNARKALYNAFCEHQINGLFLKKQLLQISASGKINVNNQSYNAIDKLIEKIKKKQERIKQEQLERERQERERLRQEQLKQERKEQKIYKQIKKRFNNQPTFTFNFNHFKPFTKSAIKNWINTLNTEFNWNIQYQQDATAIIQHNNMKHSLIQALNEHRVYDIVCEFKNQNIINRNKQVEYNLIDDIVNAIKLFNRYQQKRMMNISNNLIKINTNILNQLMNYSEG